MHRNISYLWNVIPKCSRSRRNKIVHSLGSLQVCYARTICNFKQKYSCSLLNNKCTVRYGSIYPFVCHNIRDCRKQNFSHSQSYYVNIKPESNDDQKRQKKEKEQQPESLGNKGRTENIFTIPNIITSLRIVATPYIGYLVLQEEFSWAAGLFVLAGITDFIDGYIAKNFKNQMSVLGSALDPLADKILISVLTITLTMANLLPVPLTVTIIGRDVFLILASCYYRYTSIEKPVTFSKYFDAKIASVQFYPSALSKMNTALQLSLVTLTLAAPVFDYIGHPALQALWYITAATTIGSGVGYVINRDKHVKLQ